MVDRPDNESLEELRYVSAYLREIASFNRRSQLSRALSEPEKRRAYELSNGRRSAQEVVDEGGISKSSRTIQRWWQDWIDQGLAIRLEDGSARARYDAWVIDAEGADG